MNVINIIYPQYGVQLEAILTFHEHLQILKSHYCNHKITQLDGKSQVPLLDHVLFEQ
jgi:hypothetical protein